MGRVVAEIVTGEGGGAAGVRVKEGGGVEEGGVVVGVATGGDGV